MFPPGVPNPVIPILVSKGEKNSLPGFPLHLSRCRYELCRIIRAPDDHPASHPHRPRAAAQADHRRLIGFDGAYHRFTGKVTVEKFEAAVRVERFDDRAIWELMYFGKARPQA